MKKKRFFYLKNTFFLSFLLFLITSIPLVFASEINQSLTYDGNGNLITGDGKYREYNEFNQLIRVYNGSINNSRQILEDYIYHPIENRILIKYWYEPDDADHYGVEGAVVYINKNFEKVYDNLGGRVRVNYTYYVFDETGIVGEIIRNATNSSNPNILKTIYYHNDYSGSTSLITNQSGNVVEQTFYEPFGDILGGGNESRYSYEGQEYDSLTDDYDFHFRKYDSNLMIFTQPDSIIADVYDPQTLNRYAFERNNPYKYVDKDGKMPTELFSNFKYDWRFNKGGEISNLGSDISNTVNSKEFTYARRIWSATGKPFYKLTESYTELLARVSYGKAHPFASQNIFESSKELTSSIGSIFLLAGGICAPEVSWIQYASYADTGLSFFFGTGLLESSYNTLSSLNQIQYDQAKSSTSSSSSSYGSDSSFGNSFSKNVSNVVNNVGNTVKKVIKSAGNFFRGLFKK